MRALVTGATGLIGSYLVAELLGKGHSVVAMARDSSSTEALEFVVRGAGCDFSDVELFRVDSSDYRCVCQALAAARADVVYHCAAKVSLGDDSQELVRSNVELTTYVVDGCLAMEVPPVLVYVSSIAALGSSSLAQSPASEQNIFESMTESSAYGRSKFLCQMEVVRAMKLGLRVVIVNPSVVLGFIPRGGGLQKMMEYGFDHGMAFYADGGNGFVDVTDVARAMVALSSREDCWGQSYVLSGMNCSFKELVDAVNGVSGHRPSRICFGGIWAKAALWIVNLASTKSGKSKASQIKTLTHRSYWDGSKALKTLYPEFKYSTLDESMVRNYLTYRNIQIAHGSTKNK